MLPTDLLASVTTRLAREPEARVIWATADTAHLVIGSARVMVVRAVGESLPEGVADAVERARAYEIHVVLVGGGKEARRALQAADLGPRMAERGIRSHVAADGDVWTEGGIFGRLWMRRALRDAVTVPGPG